MLLNDISVMKLKGKLDKMKHELEHENANS